MNSIDTKEEELKYAILGDDMTIDSRWGESYDHLVSLLGVKIAKEKSILSSDYIEFAKRLFNGETGVMDAILGPRLVLEAIKNNFFKITLLHESYKRNILDRSALFEKLANPSWKSWTSFGHYLLFGP